MKTIVAVIVAIAILLSLPYLAYLIFYKRKLTPMRLQPVPSEHINMSGIVPGQIRMIGPVGIISSMAQVEGSDRITFVCDSPGDYVRSLTINADDHVKGVRAMCNLSKQGSIRPQSQWIGVPPEGEGSTIDLINGKLSGRSGDARIYNIGGYGGSAGNPWKFGCLEGKILGFDFLSKDGALVNIKAYCPA